MWWVIKHCNSIILSFKNRWNEENVRGIVSEGSGDIEDGSQGYFI